MATARSCSTSGVERPIDSSSSISNSLPLFVPLMPAAKSKMRLGVVVLPAGICGKVEGVGDGRTSGTAEAEPEGFEANSPGPPGFRAAAAHFVGPLGRWNANDLRDPARGSPRRTRNRTDHT